MRDHTSDVPFLDWNDGSPRLGYRKRPGSSPTLFFLPGYASDMDGAKALALDSFASRRGLAMVRFDYSGTGLSEGDFAAGTLGGWLDEAMAVADRLIDGPIIIIGSSMGAWIALHLALRLPDRVHSLVGTAAAPDFTDWGFTEEQKAELASDGPDRPNPPSHEPLINRTFWRSGQELRLLDRPIAINCPVRLIHGDVDSDVPVAVAHRLMNQLRSADVQLSILKGGGHRLSEPREIEAIIRTVAGLLEPAP